jgi:FtsP/CotA-like multicopper oxidase with cupredoxin domain
MLIKKGSTRWLLQTGYRYQWPMAVSWSYCMLQLVLTCCSIPTIEADVGDTVVVHATNSLGSQSTSLHFHGMFEQGTGQSDGAVSLTQCPIQPGASYTYTFTANPAGTHWYHSHNKGQYPDGLRGKMIIHDKAWESSLNIDGQMAYSMSDWYVVLRHAMYSRRC